MQGERNLVIYYLSHIHTMFMARYRHATIADVVSRSSP
jgi:hypothetical protein